jgi:hypothetical protein
MEGSCRLEENEKSLMFMDTSGMNEKQKAYIKLCLDQLFGKETIDGRIHAHGRCYERNVAWVA